MSIQFLKHFSALNVPNFDCFIISSTEQFSIMHFQTVYPALMPLVNLALACLQAKSSNNRVTPSNEDVFICYNHGFDGFLACNKALTNFIFFQINYPDHFIPGSRKHHIDVSTDLDNWDWICKFKHSITTPCFDIPLPNSAVVWGWKDVIVLSWHNVVNFVGMTYERLIELSAIHIPRAD